MKVSTREEVEEKAMKEILEKPRLVYKDLLFPYQLPNILKLTKTLVSLDFSDCRIPTKERKMIWTAISSNSTLQELRLCNSNIDEEADLVGVCNALRENNSITSLDLRRNALTFWSAILLGSVLSSNVRLQSILIDPKKDGKEIWNFPASKLAKFKPPIYWDAYVLIYLEDVRKNYVKDDIVIIPIPALLDQNKKFHDQVHSLSLSSFFPDKLFFFV